MQNTKLTELSELERLDFTRRTDVAYSIIPAAIELFDSLRGVEESIKSGSTSWTLRWYWIAIAIAVVLSYVVPKGDDEIPWPMWIAFLAAYLGFNKQRELTLLREQSDKYSEKLSQLAMEWAGATGDRSSFWGIKNLSEGIGFDAEDEGFCDWWFEQRNSILGHVCGIERAQAIVEGWKERRKLFDRPASYEA